MSRSTVSSRSLVLVFTLIVSITSHVSATFNVAGLPAIKNYDFPGLRTDINPYQFNHTMTLATFKDPAQFGQCQLDLAGKTTPGGILFINTLDAYNHGCIGYQAVPDANGWFSPCAAGDNACKQSTYDIAIFVLLDPVDFCCTDRFFFRVNAMYSFGNARFQDSRTVLTGINTADALSIAALLQKNPAAFFQNVEIDSMGATDKGTIFFYSTGVKAFLMIRLMAIVVAISFEVSTLVQLLQKERFSFNLKWGVLASLLAWSFVYLLMLIMLTQCAFFVGSIAAANYEWTDFLLKAIPLIISTVLIVQAIAYTFYAFFILKFTQAVRPTIAVPNSKLSGNGQTNASTTTNATDRRRKELTFKMTLLSGVVLIGWMSIAINQYVLKYSAGYQSEFGFWVSSLWQDVTFMFIIAVTYVALNLRLNSNAMSSGNRSDSNNLSGTEVRQGTSSGNGYDSSGAGYKHNSSYTSGNSAHLYRPRSNSYGANNEYTETQTDLTRMSHHSQANLMAPGNSEDYMYQYPPSNSYNSVPKINAGGLPVNAANGMMKSPRSDGQNSFVIPPPAPAIKSDSGSAFPYPFAQSKANANGW
ncbi:hypothetical protein HDU76_000288 [Blyttiomyces sp. JEL0837]|nr:hypothetical protein HDU76_000288 [Blyttiomyces sp. JEL0837]